jgi:hypothetical protein
MNYILKGELDFKGFVMSDWSAQHSGVSSALAGLDMTMPGDTAFDTGLSFWVIVSPSDTCGRTLTSVGHELDCRRAQRNRSGMETR